MRALVPVPRLFVIANADPTAPWLQVHLENVPRRPCLQRPRRRSALCPEQEEQTSLVVVIARLACVVRVKTALRLVFPDVPEMTRHPVPVARVAPETPR